MTFRIIYTRPEDGGVSIVVPADGFTPEQVAPEGVEFEVVDIADVPTDRFFRDAWVKTGKAIATDLPKAKAIGHNIRRTERSKEFAPLDVEATIPAKAAQAEAARQVVRDKYDAMQVSIDAATNPEEIKLALGV